MVSVARIERDYVRFDASLVRGSPRKRAIVRALVALCGRELGMQVICTGVKCAEEWDTLAADGMDLLQGELFGHASRDFQEPNWKPRYRSSAADAASAVNRVLWITVRGVPLRVDAYGDS